MTKRGILVFSDKLQLVYRGAVTIKINKFTLKKYIRFDDNIILASLYIKCTFIIQMH